MALPLPGFPDLTWRSIDRDDLAALGELARACQRVDGGLGWMFEPDSLRDNYFPEAPGAAVGVFAPEGGMVACASVYRDEAAESQRTIIFGMAHPDYRNRGIGTALLRWSEAQSGALMAGSGAEGWVCRVRTEGLTEPADRLYRAHGFEPVFEELVMQRDLSLPLPATGWPEGAQVTSWTDDRAAQEQFYQAYTAAFRDRPGFPGWSADEWIGHVTENDHVPEWSLLARREGTPVGFVIGNVDLTAEPHGGFIWQVGVIPNERRRGLATALMVEAMRRMAAGGMPKVDLTVNVNNPGAIEAYLRLGFRTVGRRARYEKAAGDP